MRKVMMTSRHIKPHSPESWSQELLNSRTMALLWLKQWVSLSGLFQEPKNLCEVSGPIFSYLLTSRFKIIWFMQELRLTCPASYRYKDQPLLNKRRWHSKFAPNFYALKRHSSLPWMKMSWWKVSRILNGRCFYEVVVSKFLLNFNSVTQPPR